MTNIPLSLYRDAPAAEGPRAALFVRKSVLIWLSMLAFGLPMIMVVPDVMPFHYKIDAEIIRGLIITERPSGLELARSYANTGYVYMLLGVGASQAGAAWVTYLGAWAAVLLALFLAQDGGRWTLWLPAFVWHALIAIFTSVHTKEVHAMPVLALLLLICGERPGAFRLAAIAAIVGIYAAYFRQYWAIVGVLAFAFVLIRRHITAPGRSVLAMAVVFVLLLASYNAVTGQWLTDVRTALTERRDIDVFSDTALFNPLANANLATDAINAAYGILRLVLPFELLLGGKPQYLLFVAWELINVAVFAFAFARVWRRERLDGRTEFAAAWVLAFTLTQGIFEPDFGTFLRHQTTLLPAFALLCLNAFWGRDGAPGTARAGVHRAR